MARMIALSNLSLLGESLFLGPETVWEITQTAGFDALKVNPLRGWDGQRLAMANIPVTAFEAPWRNSFRGTLRWAWKTGEWRALAIDPLLFGYQGAQERVRSYERRYGGETIVAVDWERNTPTGWISATETGAEKVPVEWFSRQPPGSPEQHILLDTWHSRDWAESAEFCHVMGIPMGNALAVTEKLVTLPGFTVAAIDVQTRHFAEWVDFFEGRPCLLEEQLGILRSNTSSAVSAALEITPNQLGSLSRLYQMSTLEMLECLQERIRTHFTPGTTL